MFCRDSIYYTFYGNSPQICNSITSSHQVGQSVKCKIEMQILFVINDPHDHLHKISHWKQCIVGRVSSFHCGSILFTPGKLVIKGEFSDLLLHQYKILKKQIFSWHSTHTISECYFKLKIMTYLMQHVKRRDFALDSYFRGVIHFSWKILKVITNPEK